MEGIGPGFIFAVALLLHDVCIGFLKKLCNDLMPDDDGSDRGGDLWVADIRPVRLAVHHELVNLGVECRLHQPCVAAELDHRLALGNVSDMEAVRFEPSRSRPEYPHPPGRIACRIFRGQPLVEIRRA